MINSCEKALGTQTPWGDYFFNQWTSENKYPCRVRALVTANESAETDEMMMMNLGRLSGDEKVEAVYKCSMNGLRLNKRLSNYL